MKSSEFTIQMLPAIDTEIRRLVAAPLLDPYHGLREILEYHLGYSEERTVQGAQGKRIRPLLVTLTTAAAGGRWESSVPAAAAVELLHNFSLIHDDIEDKSDIRRGQPTVWAHWGEAMAINAGDAMFALSFHALADLPKTTGIKSALEAYQVLTEACIHLTGGQHLDISYEKAQDLPLESYWSMVGGKTASLIAASIQLGAICAGASAEVIKTLKVFGHSLGLSFQVKDDCLGIWGEAEVIGKSSTSDLASGKKSLPVLYGLKKDGPFKDEWQNAQKSGCDYQHLAQLLADTGAREFTEVEISRLTDEALCALEKADFNNEAGDSLRELAIALLTRQY